MRKIRPTGRMIRRDIADDPERARLSDGAFRLWGHLLPQLDSYGKFRGGAGTIQETVVPLLGWSKKKVLSYLVELNRHTSMKVWVQNGGVFVHDILFHETQEIEEKKRGRDILPPYPGAERMKTGTSPYSLPEYIPDLLAHEVEVEVEGEGEIEKEVEVERAAASGPWGGQSAPRNDNGNGSDSTTARSHFEGFHLPARGNGKTKPPGRKGPEIANPLSRAIARMGCGEWNQDQAIKHLTENGYTEADARSSLGVTAQ